jgi:hypothetical protein
MAFHFAAPPAYFGVADELALKAEAFGEPWRVLGEW